MATIQYKEEGAPREQASNKWMFLLAAALATTGEYNTSWAEAQEGQKMELPAKFAPHAAIDERGLLQTSNDYEVMIERVEIDPKSLEVALGQGAGECPGLCGPGGADEEVEWLGGGQLDEMSMVLKGAKMQARVFDRIQGRLPQGGVKIRGTLPVEVRIKRERRLDLRRPGLAESVMAVDFELPSEYFEDVDWQLLVTDAPEHAA